MVTHRSVKPEQYGRLLDPGRRLQWWVSQGPVHDLPVWRTGAAHLCPEYQSFFRHAREPLQAMVTLLRLGREPAELMATYERQDARRPPQRSVHLRQRAHMEELSRILTSWPDG